MTFNDMSGVSGLQYKWYILSVYSGNEKSAVEQIKEKLEQKSMDHLVQEILVPTEKFMDFSGSKATEKTRACLPGYILIKMHLNDDLWHAIKSVQKVSGFLGASDTPSVVSDEEVQRIMDYADQSADTPSSSQTFDIGESVNVISGPFASFSGFVESIDGDKLKVSIMVFGRQTPVVLEKSEVRKVR